MMNKINQKKKISIQIMLRFGFVLLTFYALELKSGFSFTSDAPACQHEVGPQMMMMMNYFCGTVDRRKAFSLISSRDHCQKSSPSWISDTPRAGFEPAQNMMGKWVVISSAGYDHMITWTMYQWKSTGR